LDYKNVHHQDTKTPSYTKKKILVLVSLGAPLCLGVLVVKLLAE